MYWLLDYSTQEKLRQTIIELQKALITPHSNRQAEQVFPYIGRKSRSHARTIINLLTGGGESVHVCDPFTGSGTFAYAALDDGCHIHANEWEPYAHRMMSAPFRPLPAQHIFNRELQRFQDAVIPEMEQIYRTKCPVCGHELMFDSLFYDRRPEEYFNPTRHERMGTDGENVVFRGKYKCTCGCKEKHFDEFDEQIRLNFLTPPADFPHASLIENSRINFTSPEYVHYENLFSSRQKHALMVMQRAIAHLSEDLRPFFEDTFISILHNAKYTDYHSLSQDNFCPENRLRETNLYHRFIEKAEHRYKYLSEQHFNPNLAHIHNQDFREFLHTLPQESIDLVITDPPYGQNAQYFEHAQRVHPFMGYSLIDDHERLTKEVVISNAPSRPDKHTKAQFFHDIHTLLEEAARVTKVHKFVILYFRPEQSHWLADLNILKNIGRQHGLEPLITIPIDNRDPSMRVLASAAWTFTKDICFVFYKLKNSERRWYEGDKDIDELIYRSANAAAKISGRNLFSLDDFFKAFIDNSTAENLKHLHKQNVYYNRIITTMERYTVCKEGKYYIKHGNPYEFLNAEMDAATRLREYVPVVVDELLEKQPNGFTFEDYIMHLSSFMENGSRKIIAELTNNNGLIANLLDSYVEVSEDRKRFRPLPRINGNLPPDGRIKLRQMPPSDFEHLIADYFRKRGYIRADVIGQACDRGVDILVTNPQGERELVQCKRYREGSNIGSAPIQRIDSYRRARGAVRAWVVTTSDFTREGKSEAELLSVNLINGEKLLAQLEIHFPGQYCL